MRAAVVLSTLVRILELLLRERDRHGGYDVCKFLTNNDEYFYYFYTVTCQSSLSFSKICFNPRYPISSLNSDLLSIYFLLVYRLHCGRGEWIISVNISNDQIISIQYTRYDSPTNLFTSIKIPKRSPQPFLKTMLMVTS